MVGLAIEMHRPSLSAWTADDLLRPSLEAHLDEIDDRCDALIVPHQPDNPRWLASIEAVTVSMLTGVPTPQGYGRDVPVGHPGLTAKPAALIEWMGELGANGTTCILWPDRFEIREASPNSGS